MSAYGTRKMPFRQRRAFALLPWAGLVAFIIQLFAAPIHGPARTDTRDAAARILAAAGLPSAICSHGGKSGNSPAHPAGQHRGCCSLLCGCQSPISDAPPLSFVRMDGDALIRLPPAGNLSLLGPPILASSAQPRAPPPIST